MAQMLPEFVNIKAKINRATSEGHRRVAIINIFAVPCLCLMLRMELILISMGYSMMDCLDLV